MTVIATNSHLRSSKASDNSHTQSFGRPSFLGLGRNSKTAAKRAPLTAESRIRSQVTPMASAQSASLGTVQGDRPKDVQPTVINKNSARFVAIGLAIAAAARGTEFLPTKVAGFLHLISYAANFGMLFWVTFIAGIVMFKNLSRQSFGKLQTKLFPKYFLVSIVSLALQIGTLQYALPAGLRTNQATNLGIALVAAVVNYVVEPMGTRVLLERYALENADGPKDKAKIKSLKSKFGAFHGFSSLVNLVLLVAVASHGYWLSTLISFA